MFLACNLHELITVQAELSPVATEVFVDQVVAERVVTRWYGRVCCEKRIRRYRLNRFVETQS